MVVCLLHNCTGCLMESCAVFVAEAESALFAYCRSTPHPLPSCGASSCLIAIKQTVKFCLRTTRAIIYNWTRIYHPQCRANEQTTRLRTASYQCRSTPVANRQPIGTNRRRSCVTRLRHTTTTTTTLQLCRTHRSASRLASTTRSS